MAVSMGSHSEACATHFGLGICGTFNRLDVKNEIIRVPIRPIKPDTITKPDCNPLKSPPKLPLCSWTWNAACVPPKTNSANTAT